MSQECMIGRVDIQDITSFQHVFYIFGHLNINGARGLDLLNSLKMKIF